MSLHTFDGTLDLSLRPSVRALLWLSALHIAAVFLVLASGPPKWVGLSLAGLFLLSWFSLRRHRVFGYGPQALTRLIWHAVGDWTLEDARGHREDAELSGSSVVQSWILVLTFRLKHGGERTRILLGDELDPEMLRRLRARLLAS